MRSAKPPHAPTVAMYVAATAASPCKTMSARDYIDKLAKHVPGHRMSDVLSEISQATGITRAVLRRHVEFGNRLSSLTIIRLVEWSRGKISAGKTLGTES